MKTPQVILNKSLFISPSIRVTKMLLLLIIVFYFTTGCNSLRLPDSYAARQTSYSYIPLDPLPVFQRGGNSCGEYRSIAHINIESKFKDLAASLPDQAVRLAIGSYDITGNLKFGPSTVGYKGESYQVVLDYINVDATQLPVYVKRVITSGPNTGKSVSIYADSIKATTRYQVSYAPRPDSSQIIDMVSYNEEKGELVIVPVYLGVGLRLIASVTVQRGKANLSSLGALAAEAEAGKLTGTLVVQTLGITGSNVASSLPLPSEINQTTIQNAILSLGSIKAVLYDENTIKNPRVVGMYNPIGGGQQIVNGIISVLAEKPLTWYRPCESNTITSR